MQSVRFGLRLCNTSCAELAGDKSCLLGYCDALEFYAAFRTIVLGTVWKMKDAGGAVSVNQE